MKEVLLTRRHNILSQFYPGFLNLLDDPKSLDGGELLFGQQFLTKLVSHAKVHTMLDAIRTTSAGPKPNNPPKEPTNYMGTSEGYRGYDHLSLAFASCFGRRIGRFITTLGF